MLRDDAVCRKCPPLLSTRMARKWQSTLPQRLVQDLFKRCSSGATQFFCCQEFPRYFNCLCFVQLEASRVNDRCMISERCSKTINSDEFVMTTGTGDSTTGTVVASIVRCVRDGEQNSWRAELSEGPMAYVILISDRLI